MQLWLFFTIFGMVLFIPSLILFILLNRFRNTINVIYRKNGVIDRIVITNKLLEAGKLTEIRGKKIRPIKLNQSMVNSGKWRRWIFLEDVKFDEANKIADSEIEAHLNSEDLDKIAMAGTFKTLLVILIIVGWIITIIGIIILIYLLSSQNTLQNNNQTQAFIETAVRHVILEVSNGTIN